MKIQTPPLPTPLEGRKASPAFRQALSSAEPKRLPSNFAYATMQRIHREQRKAERRQRIASIACVVVVSLLGLGIVGYFFGKTLLHSFIDIFSLPADLSLVPPTLFCLVFFALLNSWLLRHCSSDTDK